MDVEVANQTKKKKKKPQTLPVPGIHWNDILIIFWLAAYIICDILGDSRLVRGSTYLSGSSLRANYRSLAGWTGALFLGHVARICPLENGKDFSGPF